MNQIKNILKELKRIQQLVCHRKLIHMIMLLKLLSTQYRGFDGGTGKDSYGGDDVQDVLSLIEIVQHLSFASGKIYLYGESRGGLQAYCTIKEVYLANRDRISVAIVKSGVTDLIELYHYRDWNMKSRLIQSVGNTPEQLPDEYEKRSVVYWPEMINVPLLIIHGRADERVPVSQAETIYDLLRTSHKDVELMLYNAGHSDFTLESFSNAFEWLLSH